MRSKSFNPIELAGLVSIIGGVVYYWVSHKPGGPPNGLAAVELGIFLILLGAVFRTLFGMK